MSRSRCQGESKDFWLDRWYPTLLIARDAIEGRNSQSDPTSDSRRPTTPAQSRGLAPGRIFLHLIELRHHSALRGGR